MRGTMKDELLEGMIGKCEEFYHAGNYERALEVSEEILREDGTVGIAWYFKGMSLYHMEKYEEAVVAFDKAIALEPDDSLNYYGRGISNYSMGEIELAVQDFNKTLELDDSDVDAAFMLYRCYSDSGEDAKADEELENACAIDSQKAIGLMQEYFEEFILFDEEASAEAKVGKMKKIVELKKRASGEEPSDDGGSSDSSSGSDSGNGLMKFVAKKQE